MSEPMVQITVGAGNHRPQGRALLFAPDPSPASAFAAQLTSWPPEREGWWAPGVFKDDYRKGENWRAAQVAGLDVDYHDANGEHAALPPEVAAAIKAAAQCGDLPGNLAHLTPRGLRIIPILDAQVTDRDEMKRVLGGACTLVELALQKLALAAASRGNGKEYNGLSVDRAASMDLARFLYMPRSIVKGVTRNDDPFVMREEPYEPAELEVHAPPQELPAGRHLRRIHATIDEGVDRWNGDHRQPYPTSPGTCPACGHNDCFHALPEDPTRWYCFSNSHAVDSGGCGRPGEKGWWGDALDLEAHRSGIPPLEVLRRDHYLGGATWASRNKPDPDEDIGDLVPFTGKAEKTNIKRAPYLRADAGNAELFASMHRNDLRFDHLRGKWFYWAGHWWREDSDGRVWRLAKRAVRELFIIAGELEDKDERKDESKWALKSMNRDRLNSMLKLAQNEQALADAGHNWDRNPYLLGVQNGVIDLGTGTLRDGRQDDLMTMITGVPYDPHAACPAWEEFLSQVFAESQELIDFIWRAVGYSLTGDINEQHFFILFGKGRNGKSTFIETLRFVFGDYGANTPFSTLERKKDSSSIPNDLAALVGRRFVTCVETAEGARLNEVRIKGLAGGDTFSARFLFREFFDFHPILKLWLATNHKPKVGDESEGFWRRPLLIPFEQRFVEGVNADPKLIEKLKAEGPGILAWAVRGCLAWKETGLKAPERVIAATETYRQESDPLGEFYTERCVIDPSQQTRALSLFDTYQSWAGERRIPDKERMGITAFGKRVSHRFEKKRDSKGGIYVGIGLADVPDLPLDGE